MNIGIRNCNSILPGSVTVWLKHGVNRHRSKTVPGHKRHQIDRAEFFQDEAQHDEYAGLNDVFCLTESDYADLKTEQVSGSYDH